MTQIFSPLRADALLALPQHLLQFLEASHRSPLQKPKLIKLLHSDPALLAGFIEQVHPYFSSIALNGNRNDWLSPLLDQIPSAELRLLALRCSQAYLEQMPGNEQLLALRQLHSNALRAATLAAQLAQHQGDVEESEAWLAGLLHNLGKLMLFSRSPERFLSSGVPLGTQEDSTSLEQKLFNADHLNAARNTLSRWPLDSFIADAVAFQSEDAELDSSSPMLLVLLRASIALSQDSGSDSERDQRLVQPLGLDEKALHSALFHWRDEAARIGRPEQDDETWCAIQLEALRDLRSRVAELAAIQCRQLQLANCDTVPALLQAFRAQLTPDPFPELLFFLLSADQRSLIGTPVGNQAHRLGQLRARLETGSSLVGQTLVGNEMLDTWSTESFALGLLDKQLLNLFGNRGYACVPLIDAGVPLGTLVVRMDDEQHLTRLQQAQTSQLIAFLAERLHLLRSQRQLDGGGTDNGLLVREIYHELSNPVTTMRNYLYVLKRDADDGTRETLTQIDGEITRISDLLLSYRQRALNEMSTSETLDINQMIRETVNRCIQHAAYKGQLETSLDEQTPRVVSNRVALQQIITNLLDNAIDAVGKSGQIGITTRSGWLFNQRRYIEITLVDNGPGIADTIKQQLFKPVTSTKGANHAGLGLSIVSKLVEDLDGMISCHSDAQGTRFQLLIPEIADAPFSALRE